MKNLAEQAKFHKPLLGLIFGSIFLVAICFFLFLLPALAADAEAEPNFINTIVEVEILYNNFYREDASIIPAIAIVALSAILFVVLPLIFTISGFKKRYKPSPFAMGLDRTTLNREQAYIYDELIKFFWDGGLVLKDGFAATDVYTRRGRFFASVKLMEKSMHVLINRDFKNVGLKKRDHGYIAVPFAVNLPYAKEKIFEAYNLYFKKGEPPRNVKKALKGKNYISSMDVTAANVPPLKPHTNPPTMNLNPKK
jgi:hypothetical protein